jgi:hypothetical protein
MKYKKDKDQKVEKGRYIECIVEGCVEKPFAEGLCLKHYDEEHKKDKYDNRKNSI